MESNVRLLRLRGVSVDVHGSWVFVAALVVWFLATALFLSTYPGLAGSSYVVRAAVAGPPFFVQILLHELGHTMQAPRERMSSRRQLTLP